MNQPAPQTVFLKDYREPDYRIAETHLEFDLHDDYTDVTSTLLIEKNGEHSAPLRLHGQELQLLKIAVDGRLLAEGEYHIGDECLTVESCPARFQLQTVCRIHPQENTSLEGLYRSRTMFCTQCEAEGFRKITYYLDRPDVLSVFTAKIIASKSRCPVLLSNGNPVDEGECDDGRHWVVWHDPFPKPSYLFALVAGDLSWIEDHFITASGRDVEIRIYVEKKDLDKCDHAIASLKKAMRWDEEVYGREYDLDIFMIVAVDDFNMGAMENKGLNIFNTSCVLANPKTTTDAGFERVESVVAHEYFHNWSGNRVTCRDWFQLSLKEGFTVFRDAEFSADMGSRDVKRIEDAEFIRSAQFAEDAGPMAHPVRPESFIEISNFYTLTVYEKGAEVVRMIHTILGPELFRRGADLYFERHDGQAVTVEDFVGAMSEVSGRDFAQFMLWYNQAGTPSVRVRSHYDEESGRFEVELEQSCPSTPEARAEEKKPYLIPVAAALLDDGGPVEATLQTEDGVATHRDHVLMLRDRKQKFVFTGVKAQPALSVLRRFSAPVKLDWQRDVADLMHILRCETDGYARWDAARELAVRAVDEVHFPTNHALVALISAYRHILSDDKLDPEIASLLLSLPSESYLLEQQAVMDIDGTVGALQAINEVIAGQLQNEFLSVYTRCKTALQGKGQDISSGAVGLRSLKNKSLNYLMLLDNDVYQSLARDQFDQSENMTDMYSAFDAVVRCRFDSVSTFKQSVIERFRDQWRSEPLVLNSWFASQAADRTPGALTRVKALMDHPLFDAKNPNKIRSVIGVFAGSNWPNFHAPDGSGYRFLADQVLRLNGQNPQIAARLMVPLTKWRRLDEARSSIAQNALEKIKNSPGLSKDVYEVVSKSLAG